MKYQDIVDEIIAEEFEMHMLDPKGMSEEVRTQLKKQHESRPIGAIVIFTRRKPCIISNCKLQTE